MGGLHHFRASRLISGRPTASLEERCATIARSPGLQEFPPIRPGAERVCPTAEAFSASTAGIGGQTVRAQSGTEAGKTDLLRPSLFRRATRNGSRTDACRQIGLAPKLPSKPLAESLHFKASARARAFDWGIILRLPGTRGDRGVCKGTRIAKFYSANGKDIRTLTASC